MIVESLVAAFKVEGTEKAAKQLQTLSKNTDKVEKALGSAEKKVEAASAKLARAEKLYKKNGDAAARLARIKATQGVRAAKLELEGLRKQSKALGEQRKQVRALAREEAAARRARRQRVRQAAGRVARFGGGALAAGGAAAAGLVTAGAAAGLRSVKDLAAEADRLKTLAATLGVTTQELQKLEFAAQKNNVSTQELETSFTALSRQVTAFRDAGKKAADTPLGKTLRVLGINSKEFIRASPGEQLNLFADAAKKAGPSLELTGRLTAVLGRSGGRLAELLSGGREGIAELGQAAEEFGLVLSTSTIENADAVQESLVDLRAVMTGVKNAIGVELIPVVTELIQEVGAWWKINKDLVKTKLAEFVRRSVETVRRFLPAVKSLVEQAFRLLEVFSELSPGIQSAVTQLGAAAAAVGGLNAATGGLLGSLGKLALSNPYGAVAAGAIAAELAVINLMNTEQKRRQREAQENVMGAKGFRNASTLKELRGPNRAGNLTQAERNQAFKEAEAQRSAEERRLLNPGLSAESRKEAQRKIRVANKKMDLIHAANRQAVKNAADAEFERENDRIVREAEREEAAAKAKRLGRAVTGSGKQKTLNDAELAKLIAEAAKSGRSIESLLGQRKIKGNAPPVLTVVIHNNSTNVNVGDFIVDAAGSTDPNGIAKAAMGQFREMLGEELMRNSRRGERKVI